MATPRKHWFRVADSVAHEPWSNDVLATAIRILAHLNMRRARDGRSWVDATSVLCGPALLMTLTGSASLARARRIIDRLAMHVSLTVDRRGMDTLIYWPKFAEYQEPEPGGRAATHGQRLQEHPPPTPAPTPAPNRSPQASPSETAAAEAPTRTLGEPARWSAMFAAEPGAAAEHVAFVAEVLPQIEAEATARGHEPMTREWTACVKERLWAFWRYREKRRTGLAVVRRSESFAEREDRARQESFEAGAAAANASIERRARERAAREKRGIA